VCTVFLPRSNCFSELRNNFGKLHYVYCVQPLAIHYITPNLLYRILIKTGSQSSEIVEHIVRDKKIKFSELLVRLSKPNLERRT